MTFLTNDFEYSLRIASTDLSYFANTSLFEGNVLRFRALAAFKLFDHALQEEGDLVQNFHLLIQAIESLQNAMNIYEGKDVVNEFEQNVYGLALTEYSLGYIYHRFCESLSDSKAAEITEF